ncbi:MULTISPECIES: SurA N-terminal domain-containing protein [Rhodopseudomonas]|uniref:SurA N-domain family protein n=1 Tax=Rhodopseudomonas palustris TaxID=1076 RepID=A0A0D7F424_RHOPL|nr:MULTISPECIES: SurA N-terminal domain-containing protein [Rhodopseudomonas]KIZ47571.1 SurA N- domain family protein [Rhodopseudomonas palustris]MDF3813095.1 SurA N-terminal domain-containing protein [Rhodopseudomonas sp. BAL398]WOK19275.1 SurA N-terminal domain-containing protein [Rhodopseudomonas sp. BAL398]
MTTIFRTRFLSLLLCCAAMLIAGTVSSQAQSVAVMVNGEPITNFDIEQRSKLLQISTHKTPSRKDVIDELIDEKVKLKEGKKYGVDPSAAEVDASFATMASRLRISPEQLAKSLESQGVRADTLKSRMKADMVWTSLVRGRFKDALLVGEKDVMQALGSDDKQATDSFEYQMRPVVLIAPRGANLEARRKEAEVLRDRVQSCAEANRLFKNMRNAAIRGTVTKTSADLPPVLRELLDKTPIGHLTPPEVTKQGIEMVVLCSRKPTKADTPKMREIRDKMYAKKYEAKSKAYLRDVRNSAMIEYR